MKKWYCPHCDTFKRFSKIEVGDNGYPDQNLCLCCGMTMINARELIREHNECYVRERVKEYKNMQIIDTTEFKPLFEQSDDTIPVVRCKYCKYWNKVDSIDGVKYGECSVFKKLNGDCECTGNFFNENWYCADGVTKEAND